MFWLTLPWPRSPEQNIAMENNLAETSFVCPVEGTENTYSLRWFTPAVEVELCGHATYVRMLVEFPYCIYLSSWLHVTYRLAAAHALYSSHRVQKSEKISFLTGVSGTLYAKYSSEDPQLIELDFPATPPVAVELPSHSIESLCLALAITEHDIKWSQMID